MAEGGTTDVGDVNPKAFLSATRYAAGALGTTRDMLTVLVALHSETYFDGATLELMKTGSTANANYGLGTMIREYHGFRLYGHGGGLVHSSRTFYDPVSRIRLSVAANQDTPSSPFLSTSLLLSERIQFPPPLPGCRRCRPVLVLPVIPIPHPES